jgi:membrane protein implicated in regulation of membrane protease activity
MLANADEKQLLFVSVGVVVLSIAAFAVFLSGISQVAFYAIAVLALILGFYLSYNLSRQAKDTDQKQQRSRKPR